MVQIRQLRREEHDGWLLLRELLWPDQSREELEREQCEILAQPDRNSVFVAALPNGELIGFVEVSLREYAEGCETRPVGYIEGWYVQPSHRRSHIGHQLVEAAERWAASRGCTEMGSDTELWNELSQVAHLALGYTEVTRLVCFRKKLGQRNADV